MAQSTLQGVRLLERAGDSDSRVLAPEALAFVAALHREFETERVGLLRRRAERQAELDAGTLPDFLAATETVRRSEWSVAPPPADLEDRRVEITGPVDRKMMINALNSGANVFMADFEDALSPTWPNVVDGQANLLDAVRGSLEYTAPDGRVYRPADRTAVLLVRPRGWHLVERHVHVDDAPVSAALFDFGLYFFHNARALLERGTGPYFYLPKLENHLEARLWNDVFCYAQDALGLPHGTIRATVLIETVLAAFEMEEILYELREHAVGLNAGRWDYIFSIIKKLRGHPEFVLPDRASVTMETPFMRAYTNLLVRSCHRRGAHAIGGMAAFIPSRRDARVNAVALAEVRADKLREARDGFDGTWVAHPDLVPVAREVFDEVLGDRPHQKFRLREDVHVSAADLLDVRVAGGRITERGLATNVGVALEYLGAWLDGLGAVAISNLMEDAATAEICRAQLWQWLHRSAPLSDAERVTADRYRAIRERELERLVAAGKAPGRFREAAELLDGLVLGPEFTEFLTTGAYRYLP
ncbi:MAG TPA: malate synthase A [Longimicrobiales bacterium]